MSRKKVLVTGAAGRIGQVMRAGLKDHAKTASVIMIADMAMAYMTNDLRPKKLSSSGTVYSFVGPMVASATRITPPKTSAPPILSFRSSVSPARRGARRALNAMGRPWTLQSNTRVRKHEHRSQL